MVTADVEVTLSADAKTDTEHDLLLDEMYDLRDSLAGLPGINGSARIVPDTSDPDQQGGELITLALELIAPALESLLVIIRARRERHREPSAAPAPPEMKIKLKISGPGGSVNLTIDGGPDQALPAVSSLLAQLTGTAPPAEEAPATEVPVTEAPATAAPRADEKE